MISQNRKQELIKYVRDLQPMTDAEVRERIAHNRRRCNLQPLSEEEMEKEVCKCNRLPCSMYETDENSLAEQFGARLSYCLQMSELGPETREERDFVKEQLRRKERQKMNSLSLALSDRKAIVEETIKQIDKSKRPEESKKDVSDNINRELENLIRQDLEVCFPRLARVSHFGVSGSLESKENAQLPLKVGHT